MKSRDSYPSDPRIEAEIIGGCLGEDISKLANARSIIGEDHFTVEQNRRVWKALCQLADAGRALTVTEVHAILSACGESLAPSALMAYEGLEWWAVEKYLPRLVELTKRRRLMLRGQQLGVDAGDESLSVEDIASRLTAGLQCDLDGVSTNDPETASEVVDAAGGIEKFLSASRGILTPWPQVTTCFGGWQPGELSLIAARPSMGKTAFSLNACLHAAANGTATVFYSFEMSRESILKRLVCLRTPVRYQQIIRGDLNPVERRYVTEAIDWIDSIPLRIIGASGRTVLAIRSHAERLARRGKCGLIAVDYIGLIRGNDSAENRNKQLGETCRQLKALAVELAIPAIVLAQLSRASESRNDKRPQLSDLRDSGELEEHADLVALIHRPGYYDRKNPDIQLQAEFIVAKQRNGDTPVIQLEFDRRSGKFIDPEEREETGRAQRLDYGT